VRRDAWSETFLAALKAYPRLGRDANVEAWLVTIAHRMAFDAMRSAARRPLAVARSRSGRHARARPEDWDGDMWAALAALPPKQRAAVAVTTWPGCRPSLMPPHVVA